MEPSSGITRLLSIMARLRAADGCPWDREQTLQTLKPFLIEECYELVDAIDSGQDEAIKDELGDVLLQVVFQAQIAAEEHRFSFDDVAHQIADKLERRHPHVFGDTKAADSNEVIKNWEAIKKTEKASAKRLSAVDGVPRSMPALHKAHHVQKKAARVGFDWDTLEPVMAKIEEELAEVSEALAAEDDGKVKEEVGDLLFAVVNLTRFKGHDAEDVLHQAVEKFSRRFRAVEACIHESGRKMTDCTLEEMDVCWEAAKKQEQAVGCQSTDDR